MKRTLWGLRVVGHVVVLAGSAKMVWEQGSRACNKDIPIVLADTLGLAVSWMEIHQPLFTNTGGRSAVRGIMDLHNGNTFAWDGSCVLHGNVLSKLMASHWWGKAHDDDMVYWKADTKGDHIGHVAVAPWTWNHYLDDGNKNYFRGYQPKPGSTDR